MQNRYRIAIFMTNLDDLGVQRVVVNLYNSIDRDKFDVHLILWQKSGKISEFLGDFGNAIETDEGIPKPRLFFRLFTYKKIIKRLSPDLILSCVPATNLSLFLIRKSIPKNCPVLMCEHAFISKAFEIGEYTGIFKFLYQRNLTKMYSDFAHRLIMTAQVGIEDAVSNWHIDKKKISLIHNPQDIKELIARSNQKPDHEWFESKTLPILIGAGRLAQQKGFSSLIKAFEIVQSKVDCRLVILGRGELEEDLRQLAVQLKLSDKIAFLGFQINHLRFIKNSDLFVLSSVWEAMPMVVAETMAVGTPIVSFDCPSGPFEMLDGGDCGYLVEDQNIEKLAETIMYALGNPSETAAKATKAREKVSEYDISKIVEAYQGLFVDSIRSLA